MQLDRLERQSHYDDDLIYLALAASFVRKWMRDEVVTIWLRLHHPKFAIVLDALVTAADIAIETGRSMKLPYAPTASAAGSQRLCAGGPSILGVILTEPEPVTFIFQQLRK